MITVKRGIASKERIYLYFTGIFLAGIILRILCFRIISRDMACCLLPWYEEYKSLSIKEALTTQIGNYNMLYQLCIIILTRLPFGAVVKFKMLSCIFDVLLSTAVYCFLKELRSQREALIGFALTFLLPTVWINSAAWGQCDSIYIAIIIWSLLFLYKKRYIPSFILLGIALSFKLQTVFIFPFIFCLFVKKILNKDPKVLYCLLIPISFFTTAVLNIISGRPITDILKVYFEQINIYHKIALNYPSFWCIFPLEYDFDKYYAILIAGIILCVLIYYFHKNKADMWGQDFMYCALILSYTCVLFLPAMHERYGYLYEILAVMLIASIGYGWSLILAMQLLSLRTYNYYLFGTPVDIKLLAIINVFVWLIILIGFHYRNQLYIIRDKTKLLFQRNKEKKIDFLSEHSKFVINKQNIKHMALLSFVFLLIGSYRLGTLKAPETMILTGKNVIGASEIVLEFPYVYDMDSIYVYLGGKNNSKVSLYTVKDGKWEQLPQVTEIKSVYTWNRIEIQDKGYQYDFVINDEDVEIGEIVCVSKSGEIIIPKNVEDYPRLFDEQNTFSNPPTFYHSAMFDEVYHARTANEFIKGTSIYENTHPPLGKIIMSFGVWLFGMNPFGYRIMSLIFGTFMIPLTYLFVLRLTRSSVYSLLAGILSITGFMHFTLSRIGTIDIFVAFFVLGMFYFVYAFMQEERSRYLFFAGVYTALGISTKWTACYAAAGVAVALICFMVRTKMSDISPENLKKLSRFICMCICFFVVIPAAFYILSYIPFARAYSDQNIIEHSVSNSLHMLNYHQHAMKEHPYSSKWYTWMFDFKPLIDSRTSIGYDTSVVATFLNPFSNLIGLFSVVYVLYLAVWKKKGTARFLILIYVSMLLPWVFIARTVFIYQYFICSLLLIPMICYSIYQISFVNEKKIIRLAGIASTLAFIMFFPVISGMPVSKTYVDGFLKWMPFWMF